MEADNGGLRADKGKTEFHLIPVDGLAELGRVYSFGAKKYAPRNWERGMLWSRCYNSLLRHLYAYWNGERNDQETGLHHMAHVAWNAVALLVYSLRGIGIDDRKANPAEAPAPAIQATQKALLHNGGAGDAVCRLQMKEAASAVFITKEDVLGGDGKVPSAPSAIVGLAERDLPPLPQFVELEKGTKVKLRHTGEGQVWEIVDIDGKGKYQVHCAHINMKQWITLRAIEYVYPAEAA